MNINAGLDKLDEYIAQRKQINPYAEGEFISFHQFRTVLVAMLPEKQSHDEGKCLCYKSHTTSPISCGCYCHDTKSAKVEQTKTEDAIDDVIADILIKSGACTIGGLIECYKKYQQAFEEEEAVVVIDRKTVADFISMYEKWSNSAFPQFSYFYTAAHKSLTGGKDKQ
jgi:hypothetical protein